MKRIKNQPMDSFLPTFPFNDSSIMSQQWEGRAECPRLPADDAELIERIRSFIAEASDRPVEEVGPDDHIYDALGLDSLGAVAVFIDLSYHFGIPEPEPDLDFAALYSARRLAAYARTFENA